MRRFILTAIFLLLSITVIVSVYNREDDTPFPEKLEKAIKFTRMKEYQDKLFGYKIRYPAFFKQTPDSLLDEAGSCRFSYWDNWVQITQTTNIIPNPDSLTIQQGMDSIAKLNHATYKQSGKDYFIISGPLYLEDSRINNYWFHSKYVQHRKIWFVTSLTYPEDCNKAVQRLINEIDHWHVWDNEK